MERRGTFSHKRESSNQPSSDNVMPRRGRSASYQIQSKKILQDESLRSERSLQIDKSMVHHLDSMATTPGNRRPQRVLSNDTDASSITMTPGWPNYLDRTYNLRSYVQSSNRVSGGSSNNEGSGVIEDMLTSPGKRPRFRHRRGNLRPKKLGTELFTAAFTDAAQNTSIVSPPQPMGGAEISVEGFEEASPIFPKPFKRGRNIRTNPSVFQDAFEGFAASSVSSAGDTRNRPEESSQVKNTSSSQKNSEGNRSRNKHVQELEQQSDEPSGSTSAKESLTTSTDVTFTDATQNTSIVLPPLPVGDVEISVDSLEEASPIFPKPFKRVRNIRTKPSVFQDAFEVFAASSVSSAGDTRDRLEESNHLKSTSVSPIRSQSNRSGNKHVQELEQKSVVSSDSGSPKGTQTKSTLVHPGPLEQINNAALTSLTQQSSINLPPQPEGVGEICVEDLEGYSTVVSESSESREHVKTNLSLFQNASAEFVASSSAYIEHKDSRKTKDASSLASISRSNKEIGHDHTLAESSYVLPNSASFNKRPSTAGSINIHPGVSRGTEQNTVRNSTYKSVRLQNVAWFRRWQENAAAARENACYFNLLSKEERTTKLQEYVREVKNKRDEAHESKSTTKRPFVREVQDIESVEVIQPLPKKKVRVKPLNPALLVDGKPYRPHLKRPKSWATPRLYKLIIAKCEEKYGTLKARRKAENFIVHLCEKVSTVLRRKKYENYEHILEEIKISLYQLGVIKCLMEYFVFIEDYLPFNYRIKAIPCLRAYGKNTGPPLASDADLFVDLGY